VIVRPLGIWGPLREASLVSLTTPGGGSGPIHCRHVSQAMGGGRERRERGGFPLLSCLSLPPPQAWRAQWLGGSTRAPSLSLPRRGGREGGGKPWVPRSPSNGSWGLLRITDKDFPEGGRGTHKMCQRTAKKEECEGAREGIRREKGSWRGWEDLQGEGELGRGEGGRGGDSFPSFSLPPQL